MLLKAEKVAEDIARRLEEQDSRLQSRLDDVFTASYLRQQLALDIERPSKFDWLSQEARLALLKINARLTARSFPEMQESERLRIMNINMKLAAGRLSEREKASLQMDKSEMLGKYASRRLMRQESEIGRFESETRSALTEARMIRQDIRTDGRKKLVEELSAVDNTRIVETLVESRANASMEAGRDRIRTEIRWRWDRLAESAARPAAEVPEENDAAPKTEAKSRFYEIRLRNRMTKAGDEGGYGLILKNPLYVSRAFEKMDEEKMDEGASD